MFWGVWFGGVLLSRTVLCAVPWALGVLAAGFGDGSGRVPPAMTTGPHTPSILWCLCLSRVLVVFGCVCGVFGWVGCVVDRIVGAVSCSTRKQARACACVFVCVVCVGLLVPVGLWPLRAVYVWSIYPVVCWGPSNPWGLWRPGLEVGFPLRCFQRLPVPNVANQRCPWRDN